jgi:TM2 domain-containing membrane protein YozV
MAESVARRTPLAVGRAHPTGWAVDSAGVIVFNAGSLPPPLVEESIMSQEVSPQDPKDWLVTLLLCLFVGALGIHRFYTGYRGSAVLQLLTLGGCGIWALIDLIRIAMGTFRDADGNALVKK